MLLSTLLFLQVAVIQDSASRVFDGRTARIDVGARRVDTTVTIDGALSEAPWTAAALLTGFSQFSPVDGRSATDSTEVFVWYSARAIYFGIRAYAPAGTVNATLADRDKIQADDHVQILLSTFNDSRQAFVFAVNPLGVQADGTLNGAEFARQRHLGAAARREIPLIHREFQLRPRTPHSYGTRWSCIPFKSLRYQARRCRIGAGCF